MATTALTLTLLFVCTNAYSGNIIDTNLQEPWDAELYGSDFKSSRLPKYGLTYDTYDTASRAYDTYGIIRSKFSYDENTVSPAETNFEASSRFYDNLFVIKQALAEITFKMLSLFSDLKTPTFDQAELKLDRMISETESEYRILQAVYNLAPSHLLVD